MTLGIIIVTYRRLALLQRCLASVRRELNQLSSTLVVVNGDDPQTISWLEQNSLNFITIKETTPAEARNIGIRSMVADWIGFLDDDVELPNRYGETLIRLLKMTNASVLGGPDQTHPDANEFERALGLALQSPVATAKTVLRHTQDHLTTKIASESQLILCNLWIKRDVLNRFEFPKNFQRNEENILLHQLSRSHIPMLWSSELFVFHKRKSDYTHLFHAIHSSGFHRIRSLELGLSDFDLRYFAPLLFVVYLATLPITFFIFGFVVLAPLILYLMANAYFALKIGQQNWQLVARLQLFIVVSYGMGSLKGFFLRSD